MKKNTLVVSLFACAISFVVLSSWADQSEKAVKDNTLSIVIHKPINEVFEFTVNPRNTPKWIDGIEIEQTNEWPPRLGTIYKNRSKSGPWSEYKVSMYIQEKEFELIKTDSSTYHVNYTYSISPDGGTKLVYHEWVTNGKIDEPFTQNTLNRLKLILEEKQDSSVRFRN